ANSWKLRYRTDARGHVARQSRSCRTDVTQNLKEKSHCSWNKDGSWKSRGGCRSSRKARSHAAGSGSGSDERVPPSSPSSDHENDIRSRVKRVCKGPTFRELEGEEQVQGFHQ